MWLWLKAAVSTYFRRAPLALGGWEGAESADICSHITTMPSVHWMSDLGAAECERRIDLRVDGWAIALVYVAAVSLLLKCIWYVPVAAANLCAWLGDRCWSWIVGHCGSIRPSPSHLDAVTGGVSSKLSLEAAAASPLCDAVARPAEASAPSQSTRAKKAQNSELAAAGSGVRLADGAERCTPPASPLPERRLTRASAARSETRP